MSVSKGDANGGANANGAAKLAKDGPRAAQTNASKARTFQPDEEIPGAALRVVKLLGEGGFGAVYECIDKHLRVPVAVKLLHADAERSPEIVPIFEHESATLAGLDSDHIVRVRRFGFTDEPRPRPFLVMFKLEGSTLLEALSTLGRFTVYDSLLYGIHMGLGLSIAHAKGLVHRDIKPANIFLARVYDAVHSSYVTRAVILDFGIARAASSGDPSSKSTGFFGSHPYCPQEQYFGYAYPQTDLYALGVTLFLMLTCEHPLGMFTSDQEWVQAKLVKKLVPRHVNEVIRQQNTRRRPDRQIAEVDVELDELLARCLSWKPEDRPGTAEALVRALEVIFEREKEKRAAEEERALKRQGKRTPARGARTVPEPPTWMQERITQHYATAGGSTALPSRRSQQLEVADDPSAAQPKVEREAELAEAMARKRQIERFANEPTEDIAPVAGRKKPVPTPKSHPLYGILESCGHVDDFDGMDDEEVKRQFVMAGSTMESPAAAVRNVSRMSTVGGRVTFVKGADRPHVVSPIPEREGADPNYRTRATFSSEISRETISLPMAGPLGWAQGKIEAANDWVRHNILHPRPGTHWRAVLLVVSASFAAAVFLIVIAVSTLRSRALATPGASIGSEPGAVAVGGAVGGARGTPVAPPSVPLTTDSVSPASSLSLVPLEAVVPSAASPVAASASVSAGHDFPSAGATAATAPRTAPKSGPHAPVPSTKPSPVATVSPASPPPAHPSPAPTVPGCKHCGLLEGPKPTPPDISHTLD